MANDGINKIVEMCNGAKKLGLRPERLLLLNQRLEEWSKSEMTPSIAVKVLRHGEVAFEGAYGIIGPDKGPNSLKVDSIFPICSITKPVLSAIMSIMQEEGLLDLNLPVSQYIPEFTGGKDKSIRIWHLLTHTSGINDEDISKHFEKYVTKKLRIALPKDNEAQEKWDEAYLKIRNKMGLPYMEPNVNMRQSTYMSVCMTANPTHKPQKVMSYCNTGYHLAMEIVKRVSERPVDEYFHEKLFEPLKMQDSHFILPAEKLDRFVMRGEDYTGSDWLNKDVLYSESGPGGLKSNVHDMTRFGQMFLNQGKLDDLRILSKASVREITSDHNSKVPDAVYEGETFDSTWGLGWNVKGIKKDDTGMLRSSRSFDHSGFGCCKLLCDPDNDLVTAYFTVCKTDCYQNASAFNNMVIGAIDD